MIISSLTPICIVGSPRIICLSKKMEVTAAGTCSFHEYTQISFPVILAIIRKIQMTLINKTICANTQ